MKSSLHIFRPVYVPIANALYKRFKAPQRYHHLYDEIERVKATRILEIGTWNGNRAAEMIIKAQRVSPHTAVTYVGFDLFEALTEEVYEREISKRPPLKKTVEQKLNQLGASITLVQGNTLQTLPAFVPEAEPFDFIFIDGGHDVDTIKSDWYWVQQLMHSETVVIFDDYWRNRDTQGAKPVVDAIDTTQYTVDLLEDVDIFDNPDFGRLEISFAKVTLNSG